MPVSLETVSIATNMVISIKNHAQAKDLLMDGKYQKSIVWDANLIDPMGNVLKEKCRCKARIDCFNDSTDYRDAKKKACRLDC